MEKAKWVKFIEVFGRTDADLVESYFKAHGVETQLIHEAYFQYKLGYPVGRVEIHVPNFQLAEARRLYAAAGWDFDITETDDDEYDEE